MANDTTPSATEAIDADLETLTEKLCKEAERDGHSETVVALVARMARKAYMEGWYRGHQCASDLAARIDRAHDEWKERRLERDLGR